MAYLTDNSAHYSIASYKLIKTAFGQSETLNSPVRFHFTESFKFVCFNSLM